MLLSSTEAEYFAAAETARTCVWFNSLMKEITGIDMECNLLINKQGALALSKRETTFKRSKYISIRIHYLRELVEERQIESRYIQT